MRSALNPIIHEYINPRNRTTPQFQHTRMRVIIDQLRQQKKNRRADGEGDPHSGVVSKQLIHNVLAARVHGNREMRSLNVIAGRRVAPALYGRKIKVPTRDKMRQYPPPRPHPQMTRQSRTRAELWVQE